MLLANRDARTKLSRDTFQRDKSPKEHEKTRWEKVYQSIGACLFRL